MVDVDASNFSVSDATDSKWSQGFDGGYGATWAGPGDWQSQDGTMWTPGAAWTAEHTSGGWWSQASTGDAWQQTGWWSTPASHAPGYSTLGEHTAQVHFKKTYQVLSEILEAHPNALRNTKSFLDLGCAPGGFAARLLDEHPTALGYGVTLPEEDGGFPILLEHANMQVQPADLMAVTPDTLDCPVDSVDVCLADAQDLGKRSNPDNQARGTGGKGSKAAKSSSKAAGVVGVQAACAYLGIWAMTLQEFMLALGRLKTKGTFIFRFGWRGRGQKEEAWYREAITRLFGYLLLHFADVACFKSEISHMADASFYVVATGFNRETYCASTPEVKLKEAIEWILTCENEWDLPWCFEELIPAVDKDERKRIDEMLDKIGRLRAIGMATRQRVEAAKTSPTAAMWISPVPMHLTMPRLRECLERYGKIAGIKRRAHPVGVGADALVQFTQESHASNALEAVVKWKVLGPNITATRFSETG